MEGFAVAHQRELLKRRNMDEANEHAKKLRFITAGQSHERSPVWGQNVESPVILRCVEQPRQVRYRCEDNPLETLWRIDCCGVPRGGLGGDDSDHGEKNCYCAESSDGTVNCI